MSEPLVRRLVFAVEMSVFRELAEIPPFNPDLDDESVPEAVGRFRARLQACDASGP